MTMKLVKIEEGFCRGNVTHHSIIKLSKSEIKKQLDGLKGKRELKEKRKKEQEENVKRKEEKKAALKKEKPGDEADDDDYVEDDTLEANVDDTGTTKPAYDPKGKLFANFQKKRVVPNITSTSKRPAGITKGLWKQELKRQITGTVDKNQRRGMRSQVKEEGASNLGKRSTPMKKTATLHKSNTSTFKNKR